MTTMAAIAAAAPRPPDDAEAELPGARARLARLRGREGGGGDPNLRGVGGGGVNNVSGNGGAAAELFARAREARDRIDALGLERDVVKLVSEIVDGSCGDAGAAAGGRGGLSGELARAAEACTALGMLLMGHRRQDAMQRWGSNRRSTQFYEALFGWYNSLHRSTRGAALSLFRAQLRKVAPEYPSNERSSDLLADALAPGSGNSSELNVAARCLVELQVVYDALLLQEQSAMNAIDGNAQHRRQQQAALELPASWRLDAVDELCRPLAERLGFHFLGSTGIVSANDNQGASSQLLHEQQTSKMDRLPEWLFRYLRETVDDHGVHSSVLLEGVRPLVDSVFDSLVVRASMASGEGDLAMNDDDDEVMQDDEGGMVDGEGVPKLETSDVLQQLRQRYYGRSSAYFLREVGRMARHALRAKSFFYHPDVVGSECRDRTIVLRGIEQLFLFDAFLEEKLQEGTEDDLGDVSLVILPPRMADTFLSSDESLLQWWLEEERDGIVSKLHQCASSTLSSYQSQKDDSLGAEEGAESAEGSSGKDQKQEQLYPAISELFVALLHSARRKSHTFNDQRSCQMYIAEVMAPLCSEYLDMVHAEAASLRKQLLARPPTASAGPTVSMLRSANLPSDDLLASNTSDWASLITGTHLAAQAVLLRSSRERKQQQQRHSPEEQGGDDAPVLDRVGESMERLCDAMVEEYASALVETIVMERAKLASYTMRAPFLLSQPANTSPERRGQRDKDTSVKADTLALSPDLNDSVHVISVCVKACAAIERKLRGMFVEADGNAYQLTSLSTPIAQPSTMLRHGCRSIREALKFAIGQKLLDIAIDPQGMTPEIYIGGARQFQHDVAAFDRLFQGGQAIGNNGVVAEPGPMQRTATASRLMSLDASEIRTIRETFRALAVPSGARMGSLFGRSRTADDAVTPPRDSPDFEDGGGGGPGDINLRLNVDDFYGDERLMMEAINMLEAKGFGALSLDEALSILNRRC